MLQRLHNRRTAVLLALAVIVLSVFLGASRSLTRLRSDYDSVFYNGDTDTGRGIQEDLLHICDDSTNLLVVAQRYLEPADPVVDAVQKAVQQLREAPAPHAKHEAAVALRQVLDRLDAALQKHDLSDQDSNYRKKLLANIASAYMTIEKSSYNDGARAFNATLGSFPANLLSRVVGVEPLELYA